jgi:phosphate transport system substrate-binding protein
MQGEKIMKKIIALVACLTLALTLTVAAFAADFDKTEDITVISREASSGTRGAFDELMKIVVKTDAGTEDHLFPEAVMVSSTDEVSAKVEVDALAIGYTSLGAVTDKVKAVSVDGIEATVENVKAGTYKISRPFLLALPKTSQSALAKDFLTYAASKQGQEIVTGNGYIESVENAPEYTAANLSGKLTFSGSTSVEKVMEKLKEAYMALNPNAAIEITYNGSSAGIKDVTDGKVDVGMSSRELKPEEAEVLVPTVFAHDGIAVIVNTANPLTALTSTQITSIFTGELRTWEAVDAAATVTPAPAK